MAGVGGGLGGLGGWGGVGEWEWGGSFVPEGTLAIPGGFFGCNN